MSLDQMKKPDLIKYARELEQKLKLIDIEKRAEVAVEDVEPDLPLTVPYKIFNTKTQTYEVGVISFNANTKEARVESNTETFKYDYQAFARLEYILQTDSCTQEYTPIEVTNE